MHGFELVDMSQMEFQGSKSITAQMLVLAHYNGSKMIEFTFGVDKSRETRKVRKIPHSLNFRFKIAQVLPIRTKIGTSSYLVREQESQLIHLVKPSKLDVLTRSSLDCSRLKLGHGDKGFVESKLAMIQDSIVVLSTDPNDLSALAISSIEQVSVEDLVTQNLEAGNLQTALNIVMETGLGRRQLREYQLKLSKYSDESLLADFLEQSDLTASELLGILRDEEVEAFEAIEMMLEAARAACTETKGTARKARDGPDFDQDATALDRIALHNMEQRLSVYRQAFLEGDNASIQGQPPMNPQEFIVAADFLQVVNCLLYEKVAVVEDITLVRYIFEEMLCEAVENYT